MYFKRSRVLVVSAAFVSWVSVAMVVANATELGLVKNGMRLRTVLAWGSPRVHAIDSTGVPRIRYEGIDGLQFNPVYAAVYGLYYWQKLTAAREFSYFLPHYFIESAAANVDPRGGFLAVADTLIERGEIEIRPHQGKLLIWKYGFPWDVYGLDPGWTSGMAQGLAIQVFIRAWLLTGEGKYIEAARAARNAFLIEVDSGGVTYKDAEDRWWYEEYAGVGGVESRVLNGMLHAVIGLHELATLGRDSVAEVLASKGMNAINASAERFDGDWWSYYDQLGRYANIKYHHVNTGLACYLGAIRGSEVLQDLCHRWQGYHEPFLVREFVRQTPGRMDIFVLAAATAIAALLVGAGLGFVVLGRQWWRRTRPRDVTTPI